MCILPDVVRGRLVIKLADSVDIEYLVDEATLTKVVEDTAWRIEANQRIEQIRKDDVIIKYVEPHIDFDSLYNTNQN